MALLDRIIVQPPDWSRPGRVVLTAVAAVLFGIGWLLARSVQACARVLTLTLFGVGYAAAWSLAAVKVGWLAGRRAGRRGPA